MVSMCCGGLGAFVVRLAARFTADATAAPSRLDDVVRMPLRTMRLHQTLAIQVWSFGYSHAGATDSSSTFPNMQILARKFMPSSAMRLLVGWVASAFHDVGRVVLRRADTQMARVHARRVVARVEHEQSDRDRAIGENPRESGRLDVLALSEERAVTERALSPQPRPTFIIASAIDAVPEPFLHWYESLVVTGMFSTAHIVHGTTT